MLVNPALINDCQRWLTGINAQSGAVLDRCVLGRRAPRLCYRSISMTKDIIVNLEHQVARDPAHDFAISIAQVCDTHLAGAAFAYTPEFPGYVMIEIPPDIVAQIIAESEKSAMAAIERFDAAAKRSLISAEHRLADEMIEGNPDQTTDAELEDAAIPMLDRLYSRDLGRDRPLRRTEAAPRNHGRVLCRACRDRWCHRSAPRRS
jgi:hypothetical protein